MPKPETNAAPLRRQVEAEAEALRRRLDRVPSVAVIAEAGLPVLAGTLDAGTQHPFGEALDAPAVCRAEGSEETLHVGTLEGAPVALMQARSLRHGFTAQEAALSVRVLATLGARTFVLVGTAAGLRARLQPGAVMLVTDHLNLQGTNPLVGANEDDWGPRFPDMSAPYDADWRASVQEESASQQGVYAAVPGSVTPAEQTMLRRMGADAVGAGIVPEVIAARHMGRRVLGAVRLTGAQEHAGDGRPQPLGELMRAAVRQAPSPASAGCTP
jgi:purine-nucleoside phosphorylase